MTCELIISLERRGVRRGPTAQRCRKPSSGEPGSFRRPVRCTIGEEAFIARPTSLPLATGSVSSLVCCDVLEYIRDDDFTVDEIARVLAGGGRLRMRVPATGPLAGFDAYNLMHYLVDTSRRGLRPYETSEIGWRRHYSVDDLADLLGRDRFRVVRVRRCGLAFTEVANFAAMALFRWLLPSRDRYRTAFRLVRAIELVEQHIEVSFGFTLELHAERLASPPGPPQFGGQPD